MRRIAKRTEVSVDGNNFIDSEIVIEKGKVIRFSINLTSVINSIAYSLIRFDCTHGFLHEHRFFSKKPFRRELGDEISGELINELTKQLSENWQRYRRLFIENRL